MEKRANNDMSDMINNLSSVLHNSEIPPNVKDIFQSIINNQNTKKESSSKSEDSFNAAVQSSENNYSNTNTDSDSSYTSNSNIDIDTILKMQKIIKSMNSEQSSSRSNLLRSLKPYLKPNRQQQVDQYIQLLNVENILKNLNKNGEL